MSSSVLTTISLRHDTVVARTAPRSIGVPFPKGQLGDTALLSLHDDAGQAIPMQARPLLTWPDGSIKWALVNFFPRLEPRSRKEYHLALEDTKPELPKGMPQVKIEDSDDRVLVDNGRLRFAISKRRFSIFEWLTVDGVKAIAEDNVSDLVVVSPSGARHLASRDSNFQVAIEQRGPLHAVISVTGSHISRNKKGRLFDFALRYHIYANSPAVQMEHTFFNRQPPEEGTDVRSICATIDTALGEDSRRLVRLSLVGYPISPRFATTTEDVNLQAKSGGVYVEDIGGLGIGPTVAPFGAKKEWEGLARSYVDVSDSHKGVTAFFQEMAPHHPKELASSGNVLEFHFWPAWAGNIKLTRGMSKRHWLVLSFHTADLTPEEREAVYVDWDYPLHYISIPPERYCDSQVFDMHRVLAYQPKKYPKLERKYRRAFYINWPTGWRNYGDDPYPETEKTWMNNEDDFIRAALVQYMRTGDAGYFYYGQIAARHLIDIDFVDSSDDPLRHGAAVAHAPDHTVGLVTTSHQWVDGLLMYYALSGDPEALRVAKSIGDNFLRWLELRPASVFHDARETGWPLLALAALYETLHDERYLEGAKKLIAGYQRVFAAEGGLYYRWSAGTVITPYGDYVTPHGLYRYWLATGDEEVKRFGLQVIDWQIRDCLQPDGIYEGRGTESAITLLFYLGYLWTGDEKYVEMGRNTLSLLLSASPNALTFYTAILVHENMHYLKLADERGMIDDSVVPLSPSRWAGGGYGPY